MDPLDEEFELPPIVPPALASLGPLVGTSDVVLGPGVAFLQKPFAPAVLARKVREVLDESLSEQE